MLGTDAVLLRSLGGVGDRGRGELELHLAPLYADLPLWCDQSEASGGGSGRFPVRRERVGGLFEERGHFDPNALRELVHLDRPAVMLVEEADRDTTQPGGKQGTFRGVDLDLERLGAKRVHVIGTIAVYHWRPEEPGL